MITKLLVVAFVIHGSIAAPSQGEPVLDVLQAHHNLAVQDQSYTNIPPQVLGRNVVVQKNAVHYNSGVVGTPIHPIPSGQIIGQHVETFAIGQQAHLEKPAATSRVLESEVLTQVQVPVQTMQTVQVPSVQYQTMQVPVKIQKEIIEVEKPVRFVQKVPVETPPKPFVKEAIYARPFQVSKNYVKTRITPLKEVTEEHIDERHEHTTTPEPLNHVKQQTFVDLTEENLYYINRKRKVVTRFIKIEEYYEAESSEEVGVYYSYGHTDGDNFDLRVTRIYEVDQPILVKNLTSTKKVSDYASSVHIVKEYLNGQLVHSFGPESDKANFSLLGHFQQDLSKFGDQFTIKKYTENVLGKQVEVEERTYVLPGGHALFVEKRIHAAGDFSSFPENIEPVPSFSVTSQAGKEVVVLTLTYDSTKTSSRGKYGVAASESFSSAFANFLEEFKKHISSDSFKYDRLKRSLENVEQSARKKRNAEVHDAMFKKGSIETVGTAGERGVPHVNIEYHNKLYHFKHILAPKGYTPGGFIYRSDDGSEIKVEQETVVHPEGSPRNEYLRFSQVYVPRQKVKYETFDMYGRPVQLSPGGQYESFPYFNSGYYNNGFSYKYGSPEVNNPFYFKYVNPV